jgi:hypothetical protein
MKNIEICREKRTILVSKEYYKEACVYGTDAYECLKGAQRDFPKFKVVVKTVKNKSEFKNIDTDFMIAYISAHDDEQKSIRAKYDILCGNAEGEDGKLGRVSFFELKEWFLNTFPEIKDTVKAAKKRSASLLEEARVNAENHRRNRTVA